MELVKKDKTPGWIKAIKVLGGNTSPYAALDEYLRDRDDITHAKSFFPKGLPDVGSQILFEKQIGHRLYYDQGSYTNKRVVSPSQVAYDNLYSQLSSGKWIINRKEKIKNSGIRYEIVNKNNTKSVVVSVTLVLPAADVHSIIQQTGEIQGFIYFDNVHLDNKTTANLSSHCTLRYVKSTGDFMVKLR